MLLLWICEALGLALHENDDETSRVGVRRVRLNERTDIDGSLVKLLSLRDDVSEPLDSRLGVKPDLDSDGVLDVDVDDEIVLLNETELDSVREDDGTDDELAERDCSSETVRDKDGVVEYV